jgi:hypothetical protein
MTPPSTRSFAPLRKDQAPDRDLGRWGRAYGGWVDWAALLAHRRVVILAEASAGKTWELKAQAERLNDEGDTGFFVRIDDLAEGRLEDALDPDHEERFERWRREGNGEAWFFLDSVDEARLNRKSFEGALRRVAKDLGASLARARIVISCRASDWRVTEDPRVIRTLLPLPPAPEPDAIGEEADPEAALLDRIFTSARERRASRVIAAPAPEELYVVQLMPLTHEDRRTIAVEAGTPDVDGFLTAIGRFGLDEIAERPGDLLRLASYWRDHHAFGSLAEMTEHAVAAKLQEQDPFRPDNDALSVDEARHGAERLAAALTFGHAFTVLATGNEPDPTLAAGALDPAPILPGLRDAQRGALLRRGVFAPSTYGRLRFHHRGTQEYLAATWLRRLLDGGAPMSEVWSLLFAERYGVETVVPSLRPIAAWLSIWQPKICDEVIRREPLTLLLNGDPRSLSLETRAQLLLAYARHEEAGVLSQAHVEDRALWLFSDKALAPAIRAAWAETDQPGVRIDLLRCVREAATADCADLALGVALDSAAGDTERMIAVEALNAVGDEAALAQVAVFVRSAADQTSARLASSWAMDLFPVHLSVADLLALIERCPIDEGRGEFSGYIPHLLKKATSAQKSAFLYGLADAGLALPVEHRRDSLPERYGDILKGFIRFAIEEIERIGMAPPDRPLVRLLRAISLAADRDRVENEALRAAIAARPAINRKLFWASIDREREPNWAPTFVGQLGHNGGVLWSLLESDLTWLGEDVRGRALPTDRQLALSGVIQILRSLERFEAEAARLDALVAGDAPLTEELQRYRAPPPVDHDERKYKLQDQKWARKREAQEAEKRTGWLVFRDQQRAEPDVLRAPDAVGDWKRAGWRLWQLAVWLNEDGNEDVSKTPLRWRDLTPAYGQPVAEAFRDGVMEQWRHVTPARPIWTAADRLTTKYDNQLSLGGLNLEDIERADWMAGLTHAEVERATLHGVMTDFGNPEWLDRLTAARPEAAMPMLIRAVGEEWGRKWGRSPLLDRCARPSADAPAPVVREVVRLLKSRAPASLEALGRAITIVGRADLEPKDQAALLVVARRRYRKYLAADALEWARLNLALMFVVAPTAAVEALEAWLLTPHVTPAAIGVTFVVLFGREHSGLPSQAWARWSVPILERLLTLAYRHIPSAGGGRRSRRIMSARDDAEHARGALLSALLERAGPDVFAALVTLAREPDFADSARRFGELAHGIAEADAETRAWSADDVLRFERETVAPVKSGADLLRVVEGIFKDIQLGFGQADGSSAAALRRLETEEEVQNYLAEQLNLRSKGRFHAGRETEVAAGNKPDLLVTSTSVPVQIALEIKHGGKASWTPKTFRHALGAQLAEQYLLPENRRQGLFVITHHGARTWRDPVARSVWGFAALTGWLADQAKAIVRNRAGGVEIRVVGVDPGPAPVAAGKGLPVRHLALIGGLR